MLLLPTFNATLNPCRVSPATFTSHANGHFCSSCQRVVHDFSQSRSPMADLAAARAAAPDGRVCGSFRRAQAVAPAAGLTRRLRWFLLALVLIVGQGLSAREALAQVRKPISHKSATPHKKQASSVDKQVSEELLKGEAGPLMGAEALSGDITLLPAEELPAKTGNEVYSYVEQMPTLRGGGAKAIIAYIQQQVRWPATLSRTEVEGHVFASFIVGKDGVVREARIVKGLHPLLDAETMRVLQTLPAFIPGRHNGQPVAVSLTVPVTFKLK